MKLIKHLANGVITFVGGRKRLSISMGGCTISEIPIEMLREALSKMEHGYLIAKAERLRRLYKQVLTKARRDTKLNVNRDKYLAIQGVTWEAIQEIRQDLPLVEADTKIKLEELLERIEDSNHRLDAILSTRLGVMGLVGTVTNEARSFLEGSKDLPTFMVSEEDKEEQAA